MKYTAAEISTITGGRLSGDGVRTALSVITDSRNHTDNPAAALFAALPGINHNGNDYIGAMYARGVRIFLVCEPVDTARYSEATFIHVTNTLDALQTLAAHHRALFRGRVVGITGSNGKTIVKEWFAQLWPSTAGKLFRSPMSYNSQLGVALSLLMIDGGESVAVIEAGISQPSEMERLQRMIRPDVGLITNIGTAHQEFFVSEEEKLAEKLKLFAATPVVIDGVVHWRAEDAAAGIPATSIEDRNLWSVRALYDALGIEPLDIRPQPVAMRLELREGILGSTILNDSYNSDLTSLASALDSLSHQAIDAPRALILSDIPQSNLPDGELYAKVAEMVESRGITDFTGIGPRILAHADLFGGIPVTRFFDSTEQYLQRGASDKGRYAGHFVLIKGARSFGFERISRTLEKRTHTTTLEINLTALAANISHYRAMLAPGVRTMAMVKAHAYGQGSVEVAAMLQHEGIHYLAVAFADEGIALREGGIRLPIVVLNSDPGSFSVMADYDLEPEIYSFGSLEAYAAEVRSRGITDAPVHIKLDTGMHRLGFEAKDIPGLTEALRAFSPVLRVRSVFSHLAASENPAEDDFTRSQIALFDRLSRELTEGTGFKGVLRHICNSAAIARFPEAHFDMVRLGIGLYGVEVPELGAVSTLTTQIVQIKSLDKGDTVGYGRKGIITRPTRIATLPVGYADGLHRSLGCGRYSMNVGGTLCPTIGNICMDTCMLDLTNAPDAQESDTVMIFGALPTVRDMAAAEGTITYEVLTSISSRIKRIYVKE